MNRVLAVVRFVIVMTCSASSFAAGQQPRTAWFGELTRSGGTKTVERFEMDAQANGRVLLSAPFGKTPVSWGPIVSRPDSSIEFQWLGNPPMRCVLSHSDDRNYEGTCKTTGGVAQRLALTRTAPPVDVDFAASDVDLRILAKARQILSGPQVWNRHDDRVCDDDAKQNSWSLYCALYQASLDVAGKYSHHRAAMNDLRASVGEVTYGRRFQQAIRDYNNSDSTTFADIVAIFDRAERRLQARRLCAEASGSGWSVEAPYQPTGTTGDSLQRRDSVFWSERYGVTANRQRYPLLESMGPLKSADKVSADALDALASSTTVTRRTWTSGAADGVDLKGKLKNGNYWRYVRQCGQALQYYDVPAEAAAVFDRVAADNFFARRPRTR